MTKSAEQYDVVVIGAGPSGLSAARTAARLGFRTLVIERLAAAGDPAHPRGAMIAPIPGFVAGQRADDGLHFPEVDLHIPSALVIGYPVWQRIISPGGQGFSATLSGRDDFPVAVIDRRGLLQLMAQQAAAAGAELRFGITATGVIQSGGKITGVRTGETEIGAEVVLAAEGTSGQIGEEAGLYTTTPPARCYAFVVSQELEAPAVRAEHLGQIVTLGRRYTSAREAFGTVVLPVPGSAFVHFTILADGPHHHSYRSLRYYLDEYMHNDPRVRDLFVGARVLGESGNRMVMRERPVQVVRDGMMGLGDAVTPGGHLGILPAVYVGRQAALYAAEALDGGEVSASRVVRYAQLVRGSILSSLETESRLIVGLLRMPDEEIDRLCQTLHVLREAPPFLGSWLTIAWEPVARFVKQFPLVSRDRDLLQRVMNGPEKHWPDAESGAMAVEAPRAHVAPII